MENVGKLNIRIDHPTDRESGKENPPLTGGILRLEDKHKTPALEVRVGTAQPMGQDGWMIPLRIEVGEVIIEHQFFGRF